MKKIALFSLVLATIALVGCSDDYSDWADPQGYDATAAIGMSFSITGVAAIDMATITADKVALFTPVVDLPEGATVQGYEVILDGTVKVDVDTLGYAFVEELNDAVTTLYGKRPDTYTIAEEVSIFVAMGQQVLTETASTTITVTLDAPFIASAYYLVGDMCGWDESTMIPFNHSDADVYEDPVFTVTFSTTGNQYWKIVPQTNIDSGDFWYEGTEGIVGVAQDGDTSLAGTLVAVAGVGAGCVAEAGDYRMTINMMEYTYTIEAMASEYYLTGNPNGWASDYSAFIYPISGTEYTYTTTFNAAWDFKFWAADKVGDWDNIYGCSAAEDNSQEWSGTIVYSNGDQSIIGCITSPTAGLYTVTLNMSTMTYSWAEATDNGGYSLVSITGDFNGWGDYLDMTQVADHNWYYEGNIPSDGGLKFLVDHDWTVNWGADQDVSDTNWGTATQDGANITVPAGDYRIYLNDITGQFAFIAL